MLVPENFFIVYESNAGRIGDAKLLAKIVSVYGQAKGLNDALNFNHARVRFGSALIPRIYTRLISESVQLSLSFSIESRVPCGCSFAPSLIEFAIKLMS